ncbi:hypothetical protein [Campylobacter hyointestinalis]|uniref:hypothetical protein n=1 Tax=Campylobacter hyointestinalis TaxID=198 RepID=UPI00255308A1|nr:hypothetical protein [Campylobacter hyointestinalis]MDL2346077.1 hypothetical protein [Campylobacter hyointestinalis]MDL2347817.1 hypothetical protein [Campylobacter hyointestinalis]MDL2349559.1 hypothetical protein [Campylobacter hyointestinalis]MDM1025766.1 hypothetical protein [Campylobacter hyointestinalis]MDM1028423.1 hypothetical protein [Campylobacter hyointestinalis]
MKKKIVLTFDYELYLGEDSGTIDECMLKPTKKILELLKIHNSSGIFFIDATFLIILKQHYTSGYQMVKTQILDMLENGNDVGLHVHPHWIDSYMISKDRWSFSSYRNFRLHNLTKDRISNILQDSFQELDLICKEFSKHYKIDSFRAGGWCLQPFNDIKQILKDIGVKYDFSVLPGMKKNSLPRHYYDYSLAPNKEYWKFTDDPLKEDDNGDFIEIPVTVTKLNIFRVIYNKRKMSAYPVCGNGKGAYTTSGFFELLKKIHIFIRYAFSSDYMSFDVFVKSMTNINKELIVYVAHPKNFSSESFSILKYCCENYNVIKYRDIV